jgi:hypothetical protein
VADSAGTGTVSLTDCDHCRLSRSRIQRQETGDVEWTQITGKSRYCRIDHNDFGPQNIVGNMIQISGDGQQISQYSRIDHNYFHDVHFNGGNGWESIRAGLSGYTFSSSQTIIELYLFKNDANDPEIVSVKSSDNTVRRNTRRSSSTTIVNAQGVSVGGAHPLEPIDSTVAFNILQGSGTQLSEASGSTGSKFQGNIVHGGSSGVSTGVLNVDPMLTKVGDVYTIGPGSPAIDGATGAAQLFPFVTDDIEGKPRMNPDIGANEVSSAPVVYRIVGEADVG